jgi:opacity protein-like surface antigen
MGQMKRIVLILGMFGASSAFGQILEIGMGGGGSLMRNATLIPLGEGFGDVKLTNGFRFGFRFTLNTYRFFGHEVGYGYNRTQLRFEADPVQEFGMAVHQGFYNFLAYAVPEGAPVRPFFTGGAHFSNFVPPGATVQAGQGENKFGLNYGGGVKVRVSPSFLIRLDYREYRTPKPDFFVVAPDGWLRHLETSVGFAWTM